MASAIRETKIKAMPGFHLTIFARKMGKGCRDWSTGWSTFPEDPGSIPSNQMASSKEL